MYILPVHSNTESFGGNGGREVLVLQKPHSWLLRRLFLSSLLPAGWGAAAPRRTPKRQASHFAVPSALSWSVI